jgi:Glycosyl hydrolase family 76
MWAEHALDAWSAIERDAIRRTRRRVQILDGPDGRAAPLWPIAHVLWAAAEVRALGATPPIDDLLAAIPPYRSGAAYAATPRGRRYYDDNAWFGLAMLRLAGSGPGAEPDLPVDDLARFVRSGEHPEGGIRWAEGSESRNACSTAAGAWLVMEASVPEAPTLADRWVRWLDETLLGRDGLYGDRLENGSVDEHRWTYNQGAVLAARRRLGDPATGLRDAILRRWPADALWSEPPAFSAIAYRALRDDGDAHVRIDEIWDPYLERLVTAAREHDRGWYTAGGVGSYDGRPTIDQAAIVQMLALRSVG